jgi:hypothetical protein
MKRTHLLLALCLGACSPYEYAKEVTGFSAGVDQLAAAIEGGYAAVPADLASATRQRLVDKRLVVNVAPNCGRSRASNQQPCGFYGFREAEPALPKLYDSQPKVKKAITGLTSYAHGLQAVTNAADRKAYDDAAKRLEGGVRNLASAADAAFPGASVIAPAVVNATLWVVGAALDNDRFDTLKAAVNEGSLHLPVAVGYLEDALDEINNARRRILYDDVSVTVELLGPRLTTAAYKERLTQAEAKLAKLDALRHASAPPATKDLLKAHQELKNAVNDSGRSIGPLLSAVSEFAAAAKNLNDAVSRR